MSAIIQPYRYVVSGGGGSMPAHSLSLNGSGQYLSMSSSDWGSYNRSKFAIAGSFRANSTSGGGHIISKFRDDTGLREFRFQQYDSQLLFESYRSVEAFDGRFLTPNASYNTSQFCSFLIHFDVSASSSDRIKIWLNNSAVTATLYQAPTTSVVSNAIPALVGVRQTYAGGYTGYWDGLIYSLGFFSGSLPSASDIFDGSSGKVKDFTGLAGLYSYLSVPAGDVTEDAVLSPDWTNNGGVTASSTIP